MNRRNFLKRMGGVLGAVSLLGPLAVATASTRRKLHVHYSAEAAQDVLSSYAREPVGLGVSSRGNGNTASFVRVYGGTPEEGGNLLATISFDEPMFGPARGSL